MVAINQHTLLFIGSYGIDCYTEQVCPLKPTPQMDDSVLDEKLLVELENRALEWINEYCIIHNYKVVCAGIGGNNLLVYPNLL